jgi:hypothetical protein
VTGALTLYLVRMHGKQNGPRVEIWGRSRVARPGLGARKVGHPQLIKLKIRVLGPVGIHREFITAAARWIMEAKL